MQETKKENRSIHFRKVVGKTTYIVTCHFSETSRENLQDKIKRMILRDIQNGNY